MSTVHKSIAIPPEASARVEPRVKVSAIPDDMELLRAAVDLTRDISTARGAIYWSDMLFSAALGYAALAGAILLANPWLALASGVVAA